MIEAKSAYARKIVHWLRGKEWVLLLECGHTFSMGFEVARRSCDPALFVTCNKCLLGCAQEWSEPEGFPVPYFEHENGRIRWEKEPTEQDLERIASARLGCPVKIVAVRLDVPEVPAEPGSCGALPAQSYYWLAGARADGRQIVISPLAIAGVPPEHWEMAIASAYRFLREADIPQGVKPEEKHWKDPSEGPFA